MLLGLAAVIPPFAAVTFGGVAFALTSRRSGALPDGTATVTLLLAVIGLLLVGPAVAVAIALSNMTTQDGPSSCRVSEATLNAGVNALVVPDFSGFAPFP
jgi:hypothetical protein